MITTPSASQILAQEATQVDTLAVETSLAAATVAVRAEDRVMWYKKCSANSYEKRYSNILFSPDDILLSKSAGF